MSYNQKARDLSIDFIKMIAIFGVIVIHVGSGVFASNPVGSAEWLWGLGIGSCVRASVPLFLMCSGALLLNSQKELSLKKLYFHNILRIVIAMLFWGMMYKLYHLSATGTISLQNVIYSFKRVLLFDQEFHFYYIHIILIVYVFLPVTRVFAKSASKRQLEYFLLVWFALAIVYPTVNTFYPFNLLSGLTSQWYINMTYASIGYGLLGYYIKEYPFSLKLGAALSLAGLLGTYFATLFISQKSGYLSEVFFQGMSLFVCFLAAGLFSLCMRVSFKKENGIFSKFVVFVSKGSFCVYLVHMFIIYIFKSMGYTSDITLCIISVPVISASVLAISLIIYFVLSKIPVVKKYLI